MSVRSELERRLKYVTYKCEFCGFRDDNATEKFWRCGLCGCEDAEGVVVENEFVGALMSVLRLHTAEPYAQGPDYCEECENLYPCPTVKAVEESLGGK